MLIHFVNQKHCLCGENFERNISNLFKLALMAISPLSLATQSLPSNGGLGRKFNKHVQHEEGDEEAPEKFSFSGLVPLLPKERGWLSEYIHHYQGFWYSTSTLKGLLILQQHFQAQPSDILLASFPKSGTTWLKALLFSITNPACLDKPENPLLSANPHELVPLLEAHAAQHPDDPRPKLSSFSSSSSSSLMNTHIPYVSLPESLKESGCRIVYVFRDPKDVLVSCWHFVNQLRPKTLKPISLADAFQQFCRGASPCGSFWDHVLGYWKASIEWPDRVLILKYEDLKKEPFVQTKRVAEFLGHPEMEDSKMVSQVVEFCSFENLSNLEVNKMGSYTLFGQPVIENKIFFRKGQVGDSKNHLTQEMMEEMDEITRDKFKEFN